MERSRPVPEGQPLGFVQVQQYRWPTLDSKESIRSCPSLLLGGVLGEEPHEIHVSTSVSGAG